MSIIVGISDMKISSDPGDVLATYALGSCVGLSLFDPERRIGGLIHCMLPLSKIDPVKAGNNPYMFVDTGVSAMLQILFDMGAQRKSLQAKVAGASKIMDANSVFNIGERNHTVLRKVLWKNNILVSGEDVGGNAPRTMYLHMDTGKTILKVAGEEKEI
ncbi:MAG: CheD, stimulates methylation of protein [Fibrobacteres bacterium]|nr:CheD, stimulates methylation of protein [Fibrobacterota bacterium]